MTTVSNGEGIRGLSDAEAALRLARDGFNELPASRKRSGLAIALGVAKEPMFLLLIVCGSLYLVLGDLEEAMMLLGFVFVVAGITFYQERKTERALEALRDLSSPRALVVRGGREVRIPGREVAVGDLIMLAEGDRVPADAVVRTALNLSVDESLLTGESVPVRKAECAGSVAIARPGGEDSTFVYSGTMIVQGRGEAEVLGTGVRTEIGKIGKSLRTLEVESTPLQKQTARLVRVFALSGAGLCLAVVVLLGLMRGSWLNGLLAGLTLGMAMLPEEFPVVLTVFLALGAWRISKHRVLTRRVPAVETLGSASVLCVDKTGTLTMNRMSIHDLYVDGEALTTVEGMTQIPEKYHQVIEMAILASPHDPFDPMEKAVKDLGDRLPELAGHLHRDFTLVKEYPLTRGQLAMTRLWSIPDGQEFVAAAKGAPEAIADLCHLTEAPLKVIQDAVDLLASRGRRVLGVARATVKRGDVPPAQHDYKFEFVGLLGLMDPVRPGVADAVQECDGAGIRVIMITGDYPGTAKAIARQIRLTNAGECITGSELQEMVDAELSSRVRTVNVFARMVPEQKLRLVEALKKNGEVVAMTGDGVNDAPALKSAHIGIAMGGRGTDVARESASLVLLDDDFSSIVRAVRMGRRIYDNLKRSMMFIFSVHIPIAGLSFIPILFGWPLALFPVHVVILELIIDPACSLVFEAEREGPGVMQRRPRKLDEPLFGARNLVPALLQGLIVLGLVLGIYAWGLATLNEQAARALSFAALVFSNVGLILSNRAWPHSLLSTLRRANAPFFWVTAGALVFIALALTIPALREIFRFGPVAPQQVALCGAAAILGILVSESLKIPALRSLLDRARM